MTDDIKTDDKKTDVDIEMDAMRESYDKQISDLKKAIEERDNKISTLQTYIADHVTQPKSIDSSNKTKSSFNDRYKDVIKQLDKK